MWDTALGETLWLLDCRALQSCECYRSHPTQSLRDNATNLSTWLYSWLFGLWRGLQTAQALTCTRILSRIKLESS